MSPLEFFHSYSPESNLATFGPVNIHWYGLLLAVGIVAGYWAVRRVWQERRGALPELEQLMIWLVVVGFIGARLVDVFVFEWWYFQDNLSQIWLVWRGGLAWHGALLGAALVIWQWSKRHARSFRELFDVLAPGLAWGQAIGRWGNYFNQELFGLPTSLPWGIPIEPLNRPDVYAAAAYFHPTFLYESVGLVVIGYLLWHLRRRLQRWPGALIAVYLVLSGALRVALEFIRLDEQSIFLGVRSGFWVAGLIIILGCVMWRLSRHHQTNNEVA